MGETLPRPISQAEADVVRAALERAPIGCDRSPLLASVAALVVVDRCKCGCSSIDFERSGASTETKSRLIADGLGKAESGQDLRIIVCGRDDEITSLEIYGFEPKSSAQLPLVDSIRPWTEGERGSA